VIFSGITGLKNFRLPSLGGIGNTIFPTQNETEKNEKILDADKIFFLPIRIAILFAKH